MTQMTSETFAENAKAALNDAQLRGALRHATTLFGRKRREAAASLSNWEELRSEAGRMAWLHASWTEWKNTFSFEVFGRDGKLAIEGLGGSYGQERLTFYKMLPQMGPPETTVYEYAGEDRSWDTEFADFVAAINENRRPCGDIADAVANLTIIDEIYRRYRP